MRGGGGGKKKLIFILSVSKKHGSLKLFNRILSRRPAPVSSINFLSSLNHTFTCTNKVKAVQTIVSSVDAVPLDDDKQKNILQHIVNRNQTGRARDIT